MDCFRAKADLLIQPLCVLFLLTRQAGRLYLTGGATLVHRGIRLGQTLNIDIQIPSQSTVFRVDTALKFFF